MRKKITSLLVMLLMGVCAMAQVETGKLFTASCERGAWYYADGMKKAASVNAADATQHFALIEHKGATYLWSQAAENFLKNDGRAAENILTASPITYTTHDGDKYFFHFTDASGKYINMNNQGLFIDTWDIADAGNKMAIAYVDGIDMDLVNSKIPTTATITWNITGTASTTLQTECAIGEVPALPTEVPAYVTLTPATALTAVSENATIDVTASYNANMPFQLGGDNYYTLKMNRTPALNIYVDPTDNSLINTKSEAISVATQEYYKWQFAGDWVNGFTLMNKATQSYVTYGSANPVSKYTATLTDTPAEGAYFDLIQAGGKNYLKVHGSTNNAYVSNNGGAGTTFLTNWNSANNIGDAGAQILIAEAEELTTEAYITYTYIYNGQEMATETINTFTGRDMPAPSKLPYGVKANLPTGKVTGTESYDVECTVADDAPFQYSPDVDHVKWYTLTIRGTKYPAYDSYTDTYVNNTTAPAELTKNDLFGFVGNPWGVVIVNGNDRFYAVNAANENNAIAHRVWWDSASKFTLENNSGHLVFALNENPTAHLNDVNSQLGIWAHAASATDGGSTLTFTPVDDALAEQLLAELNYENLLAAMNVYVPTTDSDWELNMLVKTEEYEQALQAGDRLYWGDHAKNQKEIDDAAAAIINARAALKMNMPRAGRFYRIRSVKAGEGYVKAEASAAHGGCLAVGQKEDEWGEDADKIFYYDGEHLLSYSTGLYLVKNSSGSGFLGLGAPGAEGATIEFKQSTNTPATYNVTFNGRYLYAADNATNTDAGSNGSNDGYSFHIEDNVTLPVEIGEAGYATFYSPVSYSNPYEVEVFYLTEEDGVLKPNVGSNRANTGVILKAKPGKYYLMPQYDVEQDPDPSCLSGTIATMPAPEACYTLANEGGVIGFYSYEGETVQGFKAYYTNATAGVKGFAISFDNIATAISGIENEKNANVYDLSGRRVMKATKGIYVVNGKKVVK